MAPILQSNQSSRTTPISLQEETREVGCKQRGWANVRSRLGPESPKASTASLHCESSLRIFTAKVLVYLIAGRCCKRLRGPASCPQFSCSPAAATTPQTRDLALSYLWTVLSIGTLHYLAAGQCKKGPSIPSLSQVVSYPRLVLSCPVLSYPRWSRYSSLINMSDIPRPRLNPEDAPWDVATTVRRQEAEGVGRSVIDHRSSPSPSAVFGWIGLSVAIRCGSVVDEGPTTRGWHNPQITIRSLWKHERET